MELRLGSNANFNDPPISRKKREIISAKVLAKHSMPMILEEVNTSENKPTLVAPPIFCLSCNSKTVEHKNSFCTSCALKIQNQTWIFIPPSLAVVFLSIIAFAALIIASWLFGK